MNTSATVQTDAARPQAASLALPAQLMHAQGRATLAALQQTLREQPQGLPAMVDGARLTRFDSTALAVLLALRRDALAQGRAFSARHLPGHLLELARLYGVETLLDEDAGPARAAL